MSELRFRKRGNKWQYSFEGARINGKRQTISKCGFATKAEAAAAGAKAMNEYNSAGSVFIPSEISVNDYFDIWLNEYAKVNCKISTYSNYNFLIEKHIKPSIGKYKLTAITPLNLQEIIDGLYQNGYCRNTLSEVKTILTSSFGYAVQPLGYIHSSPAIYIKLPSMRAKTKVKTRCKPHIVLKPEDVEKLFNKFRDSVKFLPLIIGYKCGTRIGETFALTWDCIDLEKMTININKQIQYCRKKYSDEGKSYWYISTPKYDSKRVIDIPSDLAKLLKEEKIRQDDDKRHYGELYTRYFIDDNNIVNTSGNGNEIDFVIRRRYGNFVKSDTMVYVNSIVAKELGIKGFDFHSLRHTHATMLAERGASPKYVQKRLGHKNILVTMQIYQHLTEKMAEQGRSIIEEI